MRVHHLNCGTMRPYAVPGGLVCHALLVESANGLVLVDSGFGLRDIAEPGKRVGPSRLLARPVFDEAESAIRQVEGLGFDPAEVRDIVLTHFDTDHAGGLADFPWARVHLTDGEAAGALHPRTLLEKERYNSAQRDHQPELIEHTAAREAWRGFAAAKELTEIGPGIVLISLPGHTRGHAAVAVDAGDHWVVHAGDSFYHHAQLDGSAKPPRVLRAMEGMVAFDRAQVRRNHERLTELWDTAGDDLMLVNAHDPVLLDRARYR